MMLDLYALK